MIDYNNQPPMNGSAESFAYGAILHCINSALRIVSFNQNKFDEATKNAWMELVYALEKMNEQPNYPNTLVWPTPPDGWEDDYNFAPVWKQFTK